MHFGFIVFITIVSCFANLGSFVKSPAILCMKNVNVFIRQKKNAILVPEWRQSAADVPKRKPLPCFCLKNKYYGNDDGLTSNDQRFNIKSAFFSCPFYIHIIADVPVKEYLESYFSSYLYTKLQVNDTVHFIFGLRQDFDGKPYGFVQFLSVLSVKLRLNPTKLILHYAFEPSGIWWNATKELVTLRKVSAPTHVCGRPMYSAAHRADYLRLEILHQFGGIYVDMDVLVLKPFHFLRQFDFSLGEEGVNASVGLGNAVLIAKKGARFLKRWRAEYCRHYDSSHWNHYSVMLPHRIYQMFPSEAHVLPYYSFYMPLWDSVGLKELYFNTSQGKEIEDHLAIHLWSEKAKSIQSRIVGDYPFIQGGGMFHQAARCIIEEMQLVHHPSLVSEIPIGLYIRKRLSKLTINSRPCTLLWKFSPKLHIVDRTKLRCSIWETPDMDELEDSRVEIIRPNTKYYVDKQIYFYKGKYYRLSDIGLGEQWYALILDDNEPTDLKETPERFKGLKTIQKIKRGWNILFASISTLLVVVAAVSFFVGVAFFVVIQTIDQLEKKFGGK